MRYSKHLFFAGIILASFGFVATSCGGGNNENASSNSESSSEPETVTLTPKSTHIKGDLGDFFEVVDKEYVSVHDMFDVISIEVKRTDEPLPFDPKSDAVRPTGYSGEGITTLVGFGLELYDENGNVVEKKSTSGGMGGAYSSDDIIEIIKLRPGETGIIRFSIDKKNKPTKFVMTSIIEEVTPSESSSSNEDNSISYDENNDNSSSNSYDEDDDSESSGLSSSSGSTDWDEVLDEYDRYVDKYVALARKAKRGDADALLEYSEYMQEANALNSKLMSAKGELSVSQAARMNRISMKMARAAM